MNSKRSWGAAAVAMVLVGALSACESSEGSSSKSGDVSEAEAAAKVVEQAKEEPTGLTITTPLDEAPDQPGETLLFPQCDSPQCEQQRDEIEKAAATVGWDVRVIPFKSADPSTLLSALTDGLAQYDPVAAVVPGQPQAVWAGVIDDYRAAGVPLVATYTGEAELDDTVIANIGLNVPQVSAEYLANWFISDSDGAGTAVLYGVPDFLTLKAFDEAFIETVESSCSECTVEYSKGSIQTVMSGGSTQQIVSALQRNPEAKYVVVDSGDWGAELPSALQAAGIEGVKILGQNANITNLTALADGVDGAWTGLAQRIGAWYTVDAVLRHLQGMEMDPGQSDLPLQLITDDVDYDLTPTYDRPKNWDEKFKELWQLN